MLIDHTTELTGKVVFLPEIQIFTFMKIVHLNSTHTKSSANYPGRESQSSDDRDEFDIQNEDKQSEPWQYQGKRRDQVTGSYKIFVWCLLAALFFTLMAIIANA